MCINEYVIRVYVTKLVLVNLYKLNPSRMEKYTVPNIPNPQQILKDLSGMHGMQMNSLPIKTQETNETVQNALSCYLNFRQLEEDMLKQDFLNSKLDELNKELVENIANMKKQS